MNAPYKLVFLVAALVCFALAAFGWEPYRVRLIAAGLFFGTLSMVVS